MTAAQMTRSWKTRLFVAAGVMGSAALVAGSAASVQSEPAAQAQPTEQAVFLLVDRSPSMLAQPDPSLSGLLEQGGEAAPIGFTKWENLVDVVGSLSQAPREQRLNVSLGYFPEATSCDAPSELAAPVATDTLPAAQGSLEPALLQAGSGYAAATSLLGAIESGAEFCHELSVRKPGAQCSLVLVTDGGGDGCDSAGSTKAMARVKQLQASGIRTQVVAMSGADVPTLKAIAGGDVAVATAESPRALQSAMSRVLREAQAPAKARQGWSGVAHNGF